MSESILVVEYEPRYTERVRQALTGQSYEATFAKDGEEALSALSQREPQLIVLSSIIPKISTSELIRRIRANAQFQNTPILITVSGYNGKNPKSDAIRLGANDILPKPYSEGEFLSKIRQLSVPAGEGDASTAQTVQMQIPKASPGKLTSDDIFGDLLDDGSAQKKKQVRAGDSSIDDLLSKTLSGIQSPARKPADSSAAPAAAAAQAAAAAKAAEAKKRSSNELDKLLEDTLSGLEKSRPRTPTGEQPIPRPAAAPAAKAPAAAPVVAPAPAPKPAAPVPAAAAPLPPPPPPAAPTIGPSAPVFPAAPRAEEPEGKDDDGVRFGQYTLLEKIATGGMAEVWKARMRGVEGFQKTVAIKKILPHMSDNEEFVTMFVDEAKLAAQLNHNNIIHIYDLGKITNSYYIAMEFIDGHDLKSILKRGAEVGQPMAPEIALFIASKVAAALDYAHRKRDFDEKEMGLVHRDVSPQNVLISYEGDIKLCDFGIAKAASKASHTMAGALKGKLQYMSPEQAWGKSIDKRSDIFALAAVLFELLTGEKLFTGDSELSVLEQVREARVRPPSSINDEVTPDVDAIVLKALAKEQDARYETAGEMAKDLDRVLFSMRPTPSSADLAIYLNRIYSEQPVSQMMGDHVVEESHDRDRDRELSIPAAPPPQIVTPAPAPVAAHVPAPAPAATFASAEPVEEKKAPVAAIAIAAVVLIGIIGGGLYFMKGKGTAEPTATTTAAVAATTATAIPAPASVTDTATTTANATADQAMIDGEVKRRLAEEKAKLDQQRAQELAKAQAAQTKAPATPAETAAATPAEQPQQQAPAPEPPPVVAAQPAPAETPAPRPAQPAVAQVKEGDLVPIGTPGLTSPKLDRLFKAPYPPQARMAKVEGTVTVQVLVSETGAAVDAKVLRGVPQLNDAALEMARRSTFHPATKDGVRVRSYYNMTIPFKL